MVPVGLLTYVEDYLSRKTHFAR